MFNLVGRREDPWPERWKPVGEGSHNKESFDAWWVKHKHDFEHLHSDIVSQWIYRHWKGSPTSFVDVTKLTWVEASFSTEQVLTLVHLEWGADPNDTPERDYKVFRPDKTFPLPTGKRWANGTWLHPLPILSTPNGIVGYDGELLDKRYLVLDGSKRYRWLKALHHRSEETGPHKVFVLEFSEEA